MRLLDMNSLWIGHQPGPLQVLCLLSAAAQGHKVRLFSYTRYNDLPGEIEQVDAREILPESESFLHSKTGSPAMFSDRFRYNLVHRGFGAWMDGDMLVLRPVHARDSSLFCWEDHRGKQLGTSMISFAPGSDFGAELVELSARRDFVPPWRPALERTFLHARRLVGRPIRTADMRFTTIGPDLFTHLARKHGMLSAAGPWQQLYAIPYKHKLESFSRDGNAALHLRPETDAVHLWHQGLHGGADNDNGLHELAIHFEEGSFVWSIARELGMRPQQSWRA